MRQMQSFGPLPHRDPDMDVIAETGRIGEIISSTITAPMSAARQAEEEAPLTPGGSRRRIIAVVAPKGGLGKTTVATNLAVGLARLAPHSVVLIDADVQFGDVAMALSLEPSLTLPDVVSSSAVDDLMVLKSSLTAHPSGLYTVCGSDQPDIGDRVTGEQLAHLINQLADVFRYIIIDTAPGLGDHALTALELATDAVFLCDMTVPSARGLRKELAVLDRIGIMPPARHVVLNLADGRSGLTVRDIEATTGVPVDIAIPRSILVPVSINRGVPLLQEGRHNPVTRALNKLVARFDAGAPKRTFQLHKRVDIS